MITLQAKSQDDKLLFFFLNFNRKDVVRKAALPTL